MEKLRFSVDSALLSELGEKLVESVHIALLELVKNAYDADATRVTVEIQPANESYSIRISDNGSGMTLKQVRSYWMRIATANKAYDDTTARFGRKKSGSKGIGRFSCRRLGSVLDLTTTGQLPDGRYETTKLHFDWEEYATGTDVNDIECVGTTTRSRTGQTGTILEIANGNPDEWTRGGWRVLKRRLILLVSNRGTRRKGYDPDPGFNVSLVAPDFEESDVVDQREQLMDAGWGRLTLRVDSRGKAKWELSAKRIGHKRLVLQDRYPDLAGTTADIAIMPDKKEQFRIPGAVGIVGLRHVLDEWGGVHVRVDGIRVYPYGEGRNDWLYIDRDRAIRTGPSEYEPISALAARLRGVDPGRVLLNMLSAKSYIGEVNAASPSSLFQMKASREGFVGERGIERLSELVRIGVDWSTVYRDFYLRREDQRAAREARSQFEEVASVTRRSSEVIENAVDYLQKEVKQIASQLPIQERREVVSNIGKAAKAVLATTKVNREELRHLRLIASTSSLLLIFAHEVKSLLSALDDYDIQLSIIGKQLSGNAGTKVEGMRRGFRNAKKRFIDLLGMTSLLSVESKDAKAVRLAIAPRAEKAKSCFKLITDRYDIDIDVSEISKAFRVGPMLEAELYSILLNVLSNSIKSVIARGATKRIAIRARRVSSGLQINCLDTGVGVTDEWHELFEPFTADPERSLYRRLKRRLNPQDEYVVGTGSGLGLSIVREIVEAHEGKVGFNDAPKGWTCNLEVVLP